MAFKIFKGVKTYINECQSNCLNVQIQTPPEEHTSRSNPRKIASQFHDPTFGYFAVLSILQNAFCLWS